jgi:hypothetical protein
MATDVRGSPPTLRRPAYDATVQLKIEVGVTGMMVLLAEAL